MKEPIRKILSLAAITLLPMQSVHAGDPTMLPITTDSKVAKLHYIAGLAAEDRGDGNEANSLFRAAAAEDAQFASAWLHVGINAASGVEFNEAVLKAQSLADKASKGERLMIEAMATFLDNDFERQIQLAEQLTEVHPDSPRAWLTLGNAFTNLNRHEEARKAYKRATKVDPEFAVAHTSLGASYIFNEPKDFAQAENHYRAAIRLQPGEDNHYWGLGDVHRADNDLDAARQMYTLAVQLDPNNGTAFVKRAHVNSFLGNYEEARADYDRGVEAALPAAKAFLANYKMFTWVYAGDAKMSVKKLRALYEQLGESELPRERVDGARVFTLSNAATISMDRGMYDDAAELLRMRATVVRSQGGTEETKAIQEANIAYFDGLLAARRGEYDLADKMAKKNARLVAAQDNARKMENYHDLMGLIALRQGRHQSAVEHYRQANLNSIYTKYHLALALEGVGEMSAARAAFADVARWNFNTVGYALVRDAALAKSGGSA